MSLANSEDPDEELHNAAFHRGLHSTRFLRQKQSLEKEIQYYGRLVVLLKDLGQFPIQSAQILTASG